MTELLAPTDSGGLEDYSRVRQKSESPEDGHHKRNPTLFEIIWFSPMRSAFASHLESSPNRLPIPRRSSEDREWLSSSKYVYRPAKPLHHLSHFLVLLIMEDHEIAGRMSTAPLLTSRVEHIFRC